MFLPAGRLRATARSITRSFEAFHRLLGAFSNPAHEHAPSHEDEYSGRESFALAVLSDGHERSRMELPRAAAERDLARVLQLAYSGERAAAYAYRGHWKSVSAAPERARIQAIEAEELHHRRLVGEMLRTLRVPVSHVRELRAALIGRVLGCLCRVTGKLLPLYGAGKLESRNIREYEAAARFARASGRHEWIDCLLTMAEVEWDHESYFRGCVEQHWLGRRLSLWPRPPAKALIRKSFEREAHLTVATPNHVSAAQAL